MLNILRDPSFLPSCILAGIGVVFLVLVSVLPLMHMAAVIGGTALAIGLVVARLRREAAENEPSAPARVRG